MGRQLILHIVDQDVFPYGTFATILLSELGWREGEDCSIHFGHCFLESWGSVSII
jgi:hypothetical protein